MPLVSVIIPAYNCSRFIAETVGSILGQQGGPDVEVIVVDDGSTDNTAEIVRGIAGPVRLVEQANRGVCAARNRGIREAQGDFIALVDHDDYWLPNKLAGQMAAFEAHPEVDVVFTAFAWWHPDPATGRHPPPADFAEGAAPQGVDPDFCGYIYHRMLLDSWVLTSTALARAGVVRAAGFDETLPFSEDWDFWLRISRDHQFLKLKEKTTLYRQHPTQGSRVVRPVDYRTLLLERAYRQWGLQSPDGRGIAPARFKRKLAEYSAEFGFEHLKDSPGADRATARRAFLKAWRIDPGYWQALAYLAASNLGWRPKWVKEAAARG